MSSKQSPRKLKKAKLAKSGTKDVKPKGSKEPSPLSVDPGECAPIQKAKLTTNISKKLEDQNCNRPRNYTTTAEKRSYLESKVTPVLMEGMLGLARDQPTDPISYLEEYWLKEQHKCNINLKQNSI